MRHSPSLPLLVLALLLAGCAAEGPAPPRAPPPAEDASDAAAPAFGPPLLALPSCIDFCFEPSVAADPEGRLFAMSESGEQLAVSTDGGASFRVLPGPPPPPGAPPQPPQGAIQNPGVRANLHQNNRTDSLLQVAPDGRLYYSSFGAYKQGFHVAWSDDGGETWGGNALVLPSPLVPGRVDRQWLGFGPAGEVYLSFSQIPSGIWAMRSDDGGATFGEAALVSDAGGFGQSGPPVVDAQGRVLVPFLGGAPLTAGGGAARNAVVLAVSEDGGRTFRHVEAHASPEGAGATSFPVLAAAPEGILHLAWLLVLQDAGRVDLLVSSSRDGGATWSAPAVWAEGVSPVAPWVAPSAAGLDVAWFSGDEALTLHVARASLVDGAPGAPAAAMVAGGLREGGTHFAHLARLPDGRLAAAWNAEWQAFVAVEAPRSA